MSEDDLRRDVVQLTALMPDLVPGGPGARHADVVGEVGCGGVVAAAGGCGASRTRFCT